MQTLNLKEVVMMDKEERLDKILIKYTDKIIKTVERAIAGDFTPVITKDKGNLKQEITRLLTDTELKALLLAEVMECVGEDEIDYDPREEMDLYGAVSETIDLELEWRNKLRAEIREAIKQKFEDK